MIVIVKFRHCMREMYRWLQAEGCVDMIMLKNGVCEVTVSDMPLHHDLPAPVAFACSRATCPNSNEQEACNVTSCGYDYGDCGVPVPDNFRGRTCFPGFVFDCSLSCVSVAHIRDRYCDDGSSSDEDASWMDPHQDSILPDFNCQDFFWFAVPSVSDCLPVQT